VELERGIGRNIAAGENVEHELTRLIEKRHDQRAASEGERPAEELWAALSVPSWRITRSRLRSTETD
jgi:hypothetical protein